MITLNEQAELIEMIDEAEGFKYESFTSASGIESNFKIELAEAMDRNYDLRLKIAHYMIEELVRSRVNMIVATGGAVSLAMDVAAISDWNFAEIQSNKDENGQKKFSIDPLIKENINQPETKYAFVEDVSSTWGTVLRSILQSEIKDPEIAISGWRRGVRASSTLSGFSLKVHNKTANRMPVFEEKTRFRKKGIINKPAALFIDSEEEFNSLIEGLKR